MHITAGVGAGDHLLTSLVLHTLLQGDKNNLILASGIVRTERELHKLFTTLAERYAGREGGYTRVVQIGRRQHDSAPMAFIE